MLLWPNKSKQQNGFGLSEDCDGGEACQVVLKIDSEITAYLNHLKKTEVHVRVAAKLKKLRILMQKVAAAVT